MAYVATQDLVQDRLLSGRFAWIKLASALYVLAIPVSHGMLPDALVWDLALIFLLLMLPPYPNAAWRSGAGLLPEISLALSLAVMAVLGYVLALPALIILAIITLALWDLAKQRGAGTPFFGWYVTGCCLVDLTYAAALIGYLTLGAV